MSTTKDASDSPPGQGRPCFVLFSGGLDSTVCLAWAARVYSDVTALWVDYGQVAGRRERSAARQIARYYGIRLIRIKLKPRVSLPKRPTSLVPGRNLFLLSAARMLLPDVGGAVVIGSTAADSYFDSKASYLEVAESLLQSTEHADDLRIEAPLVALDKPAVMALAREFDAPIWATWSCHLAGRRHCGHCDGCKTRQLAFESITQHLGIPLFPGRAKSERGGDERDR